MPLDQLAKQVGKQGDNGVNGKAQKGDLSCQLEVLGGIFGVVQGCHDQHGLTYRKDQLGEPF